MRRRPPLKVGSEYNDWKVVRQVSLTRVVCECKCHVEYMVNINHLLSGRSKRCRSCGNRRPSHKWRPPEFDKTEKKYPHKLKCAVTDAIRRCNNQEDRCYPNWGGRGIKVHAPWLEDPRLFIEYLMTLNGWDNSDLVLDRMNNDGNYEPGNLRWATYLESANNQRHNNGRQRR